MKGGDINHDMLSKISWLLPSLEFLHLEFCGIPAEEFQNFPHLKELYLISFHFASLAHRCVHARLTPPQQLRKLVVSGINRCATIVDLSRCNKLNDLQICKKTDQGRHLKLRMTQNACLKYMTLNCAVEMERIGNPFANVGSFSIDWCALQLLSVNKWKDVGLTEEIAAFNLKLSDFTHIKHLCVTNYKPTPYLFVTFSSVEQCVYATTILGKTPDTAVVQEIKLIPQMPIEIQIVRCNDQVIDPSSPNHQWYERSLGYPKMLL